MTPIFKIIPCQCGISIAQSSSHGTDEKPGWLALADSPMPY